MTDGVMGTLNRMDEGVLDKGHTSTDSELDNSMRSTGQLTWSVTPTSRSETLTETLVNLQCKHFRREKPLSI